MFTNGEAQNPIDKINPIGINRKNIPIFRLVNSPIQPIIKGIMAAPVIPVHKIPDKEPWCLLTEFNAKEKMIDHITDMKKPTKGKQIRAILALPVNANNKEVIAAIVVTIKIFRLSIIFNKTKPNKQPTVSIAQK